MLARHGCSAHGCCSANRCSAPEGSAYRCSAKSVLVRALLLMLIMSFGAGLFVGCSRKPGAPSTPRPPVPPATPGAPAPSPPQPSPGVGFSLAQTFSVDGDLWGGDPKHNLSPDGRYALAVTTTSQGMNLVAIDTEGLAPVTLHSSTKQQMSQWFRYEPLGFTGANRAIFAIAGTPVSGPHKGRSGVAIMEADIPSGSAGARENAFIDLGNGNLIYSEYSSEQKRAYLFVSRAIWEYNVETRAVRLVKGNLPEYDSSMGEFYPRVSPGGRYILYDRSEGGAAGIFMLDAATGKETALIPAGDTLSFYPTWSPDGKYIAAYTVGVKNSSGKTAGQKYDILYGEEGPLAAGQWLSVYDAGGTLVQKISLAGKTLTSLRWNSESTHLAFGAGSLKNTPHMPEVQVDSVYIAAIGKDPTKLSDVAPGKGSEFVYTAVVGADPDGQGAIANEFRQQNIVLRHLRLGAANPEIQKITGELVGWNFQTAKSRPMIGLVESKAGSSIWAFAPSGWTEVASFGTARHTTIVGYSGDILVISNSPLFDPTPPKPGAPEPKATIQVFRWK